MARRGLQFGGYDDVIPHVRKNKKVTITQAQINALFTTPVVLLTGDANTYVHIDRFWMVREAGTAYAGAVGNLLIRFNATTWYQLSPTVTIGVAGPRYLAATHGNFSTIDVTTNLGLSWDVKLQTADPTPATGSGNLVISFSYMSIFVGRR